MSEHDFHPLVKQLLDGDLTLADLPPELRAQGVEAVRLLAAVDRRPVELPALTPRVMQAISGRPARAVWRRIMEPREIRLRFRPWLLAPALALAAALILWIAPGTKAPAASLVTIRFVLMAPEARAVSLAGTFNQWDAHATPLVRAGGGASGLWTATLTLPAGQHQYAFVVDGVRWVPDPGAPSVDDGFGRRNSVLTL
jgi:hypothetical protein